MIFVEKKNLEEKNSSLIGFIVNTLGTEDYSRDMDKFVHSLNKRINALSGRQKYVITNSFGLNGIKIKSKKEIADYVGMSQESLLKYENKIIGKLEQRIERTKKFLQLEKKPC